MFIKCPLSDTCISVDFYQSTKIKHSALNSMIYGVVNIPLSISNFKQEFITIKTIATNNGYSVELLRKFIL